jgi:sugar phosphate isomerase/epimerase
MNYISSHMNYISRRQLLGAAAGLAAGAGQLRSDPLGLPIGCQVYPVREAIGKDFEGTLRQIAAIGYRNIEMCSPPSYASSGFGSLINMKAPEMRKAIQAAGLRCESCHYNLRELKENLEERIAYAKELGLTQMVLASPGVRPGAPMADWARAAEELNKIGEQTQKAGIQAGYHNHDGEFHEIDGVLIYDELMRRFDAKLVRMQFQVSVISLGFEAAAFLAKKPGRFISMHLQDWSPTTKKTVAVGAGAVDWKKTFAAAKTGGVKNYFVEMDMEAMKASYPYLHNLKV